MDYIGTSGWTYADWNGRFYPPGLPQRDRLTYYAERFDTVELNASYYHWPKDAQFTAWRDRLPDGFAFTVKAPKYLTHTGSLADTTEWSQKVAAGLDLLGSRSGTLLLQFPPRLQRDDDGLAALLGHFAGRRMAVEFRHASWRDQAVLAILREHDTALVQLERVDPALLTAGYAYVRMHGPDPRRPYRGSYPRKAVRRLRIR